MPPRDRAWLRTFLNLGARATQANIAERDILRQEDTVLRALDLLDESPGIVLADEVGMGKTFEALGVIAARATEDPSRRFLIITPGPDLNRKWHGEFQRFGRVAGGDSVYAGFTLDAVCAVTELPELVRESRLRQVVVAPITSFLRGVREAERDLIDLFCRYMKLSPVTRAAIYRRYRGGGHQHPAPETFLGGFTYDDLAEHLDAAFREDDAALAPSYEREGNDLFRHGDDKRIYKLLARTRTRLTRALLPDFDLLVVDEAHKLKNRETKRFTSLSRALRGRFERALFLTATPFQLGPEELRQIFALFALARGAPADLVQRAEGMLCDIREYQDAYAAFEACWRRVDPGLAAELAAYLKVDPSLAGSPQSPALRPVIGHIRRLLELKDHRIEPAFRRWMVRSRRDDRFTYREHRREALPVAGPALLPFLAYERLIAELFAQKAPTHKAAVEINLVSSYGAAAKSDMFSAKRDGKSTSVDRYRHLLREVLEGLTGASESHPKLSFVMRDVLRAAAVRGEKTLIFCARTETLSELQRGLQSAWEERLLGRWRRAFPDASHEEIFGGGEDDHQTRGRQALLGQRFHRTQDLLYLALREPYLHTLLDFGEWGEAHVDAILGRAEPLLREVRTGATSAERVNFAILKRVVEVAAVELRRALDPAWAAEHAEVIARLTDPRYIALGYDLIKDDLEDSDEGPHVPTWSISREHALHVLRPAMNLWTFFRGDMFGLPEERRVRVVERLARYLTTRWVPFVADLVTSAHAAGLDLDPIASRDLLNHLGDFWTSDPGRRIRDQLREFLRYFHDELDEGKQREILDARFFDGKFARQTRDGDTRERLREAFNTPLHPMVLIANEVMQEGLDLQRSCIRVIHHDLPWNPAQLEQRVGRVDRLGGRIHKLRDRRDDARLEILYPLISRTIDTRIHQIVRQREKWLEFFLGAPPEVGDFSPGVTPPPELPAELVERLRIDLRPWASA